MNLILFKIRHLMIIELTCELIMYLDYTYISGFHAFTRFKRNDEKKSNFVRTLLGLPHTHCAHSTTRRKGVKADLGPVAGVVRAARCARRDVTRGDAATSATQFVDERDAVYSRQLCSSSPSCHRESWQFARWQFADWSARLSSRAIASFDSIFSRFFSLSKKNQILNHGAISKFRDKKRSPLGLSMSRISLLNRRGWSSFRQI